MKNPRNRHNPAGFTLMELLVVVSIIVILAGLTLGGMSFANAKTAREQTKTQLGLLEMALESYYSDSGEYPKYTSSSAKGSQMIYRNLFYDPVRADEQAYLKELDPDNDTNGWFGGKTSGSSLKLYDPFGTEYYYRSGNRAVNPDFDLWSAGPDGQTNVNSYPYREGRPKSSMDKKNRDDIRLW